MENLETIYTQILELKKEKVWVPAEANNGLKLLLEELLKRGWKITPPEPVKK